MRARRLAGVELGLRSLAFGYIALLIILPACALTAGALQRGLAVMWHETTLPQALFALRLTFTLALVVVLVNLVTGTATAWALVRYEFPGKNLLNALVDLPFAIPTVVTGIMLVALYGPNSILGGLFQRGGIEVIYSKPGIVLALLFVTFPFVVRSVQPVLVEMEREMEDAAQTLGATPVQTFVRVVIPTLLPSILTGAALSFSRALGEFGSVVIVAGNIPFKTLIAPVYVYGEIESNNMPGATSVALVLLLVSFLVLIAIHFLQRWSRRHEAF